MFHSFPADAQTPRVVFFSAQAGVLSSPIHSSPAPRLVFSPAANIQQDNPSKLIFVPGQYSSAPYRHRTVLRHF